MQKDLPFGTSGTAEQEIELVNFLLHGLWYCNKVLAEKEPRGESPEMEPEGEPKEEQMDPKGEQMDQGSVVAVVQGGQSQVQKDQMETE